jgi:hypothetical protein
MVNRTHVGSIGVGGSAGEVPGDGRWRGSGGASVAAQISAKCGVELGLVWVWELEWRLGWSFELSVDHGHKRRRELTGRQQWRVVTECGDVRARTRRRGVYRQSSVLRRFRPTCRSQEPRHGRGGSGDVRRGSGQWRGARASAGECGEVAWHWPRKLVRVTILRHTVPNEVAWFDSDFLQNLQLNCTKV